MLVHCTYRRNGSGSSNSSGSSSMAETRIMIFMGLAGVGWLSYGSAEAGVYPPLEKLQRQRLGLLLEAPQPICVGHEIFRQLPARIGCTIARRLKESSDSPHRNDRMIEPTRRSH
jgi:hypothetical protein